MAFTNASPLMATTRGKEPFFGTNPLSLAAPANNGDSFVLDMATSVVALGKVEIADRKGETIPEGWAIGKNGQQITEPKELHALLPLGGPEKSSNQTIKIKSNNFKFFYLTLQVVIRVTDWRCWSRYFVVF
jgi:LDH2 family malate/lactate/ureidoglycolate dehydrogenase